jgi:hypothetical protein
MPTRKEVRWFTRGEFARTTLPYEGIGTGTGASQLQPGAWAGGILEGVGRGEKLLGSQSSVFSFTRYFRELAAELEQEGHLDSVAQSLLTVDGGPHTLWW